MSGRVVKDNLMSRITEKRRAAFHRLENAALALHPQVQVETFVAGDELDRWWTAAVGSNHL